MSTVIKETADQSKEIIIQKFVVARPPVRTDYQLTDLLTAIQFAELKDFPNRVQLYDIYSNVILDPHLKRQWEKRVENITNTQWLFTEMEKENKEIKKFIDTPVFEDILKEIMESVEWGKTLLEMEPKTVNAFGKDEKSISLYSVPRKHIRPKQGVIVKEQWDSAEANPTTGLIPYREAPYSNYVADIGKDDDLGILLEIAAYVILKKGGVSDWALFVQLFGQPLREYKYDGFNEIVRQQLEKSAQEMASAPYIILPDGSSVTLHDIKNNNTGDIHGKLVEYCDKMISIRILGNTETTQSSKSSGYAQAEIHQETQDDVYEADKRKVRRVLNNIIRPILWNLGYPVENGLFHPKESANLDKVLKRLKVIQMMKSMGTPVDDDTIYEEADIPKPDNYDQLKADMEAEADAMMEGDEGDSIKPKAKKKSKNKELSQVRLLQKIKNAVYDFFDPAP